MCVSGYMKFLDRDGRLENIFVVVKQNGQTGQSLGNPLKMLKSVCVWGGGVQSLVI